VFIYEISKDKNDIESAPATVTITVRNGGTVEGKYWIDANSDNILNNEEEPIANATVDLVDASGNVVATMQTDENGKYKFENVRPGDYQVKFTLPEDYVLDGFSETKLGSIISTTVKSDEISIADNLARCTACDGANGASALGWIAGLVMLLMMSTILYTFRRREA